MPGRLFIRDLRHHLESLIYPQYPNSRPGCEEHEYFFILFIFLNLFLTLICSNNYLTHFARAIFLGNLNSEAMSCCQFLFTGTFRETTEIYLEINVGARVLIFLFEDWRNNWKSIMAPPDLLTQMNTYRSYVTMLADAGAKDETKLKAAQELSENFEVRNLLLIYEKWFF